MDLPGDPAIAFLGIYHREMKSYVSAETCMRMLIAALFVIAKNWKFPKYVNGYIFAHPYYGILSSNKKK